MLLNIVRLLFTNRSANATLAPTNIKKEILASIRNKDYICAKSQITSALKIEPGSPDLTAMLGEVEFFLGNNEDAEGLFIQSLKKQPYLSEAHLGLSMLKHEQGDYQDALAHAQFAEKHDSNNTRILSQLGLCYISLKNYDNANNVLLKAAALDPDNPAILTNLAISQHARGELNDAIASLARALEINPTYQPAHDNLEICFPDVAHALTSERFNAPLKYNDLSDQGAFIIDLTTQDTASSSNLKNALIDTQYSTELENILADNPQDIDSALKLSKYYIKTHKPTEAYDILTIAIQHNPQSTALRIALGNLEQISGKPASAAQLYQYALTLEPENTSALAGLGLTALHNDDFFAALDYFKRAVNIDPTVNNLGYLASAQANACQYPEALSTCDRLTSQFPYMADHVKPVIAMCNAYLGDFELARDLASRNNNGSTQERQLFFLSTIDLLHENYERGWELYKSRFVTETRQRRLLPQKWWNGEDLLDKTILILAEQGLGDQVMFASCIKDLLQRSPRKIILEVEPRLVKLFARSFPELSIIPYSKDEPSVLTSIEDPDYYAPIGDLPRHFRRSIDDFPSHVNYLTAAPDRVNHWKQTLNNLTSTPCIGITWRGGTQRTRKAARSLTLYDLIPILSNQNVTFISLQYGEVGSEIEEFRNTTGINLIQYPDAIRDLDEFAALICALDQTLTVCNTTVHFAGALGQSAWVMAPAIPEWRYGLTHDHLRWYPTTNIFRQASHGNWESVIARAQHCLETFERHQDHNKTKRIMA